MLELGRARAAALHLVAGEEGHVRHVARGRQFRDALPGGLNQLTRQAGPAGRPRAPQCRLLGGRKQVDHRGNGEDDKAGRGQEGALFHRASITANATRLCFRTMPSLSP